MVSVPSELRVGLIAKDLRTRIGWTQRELARRAGVSQALVCAIETGRVPTLTFATASRLLEAMGARLIVDATLPFLGDRERQRDAAHVRCAVAAARRLERAGWTVASEVEIGGDRSRGWIDLLAFHPATRTVLVIEIKTELHDIGAIERSLHWYQREAWAAARRLGHRPARVRGCLLVLATAANDVRIQENSAALSRAFPVRARELATIVVEPGVTEVGGNALALFDPRSKRRDWLRPTTLDGRRSPAPYPDYVGFMARIRSGINRSG